MHVGQRHCPGGLLTEVHGDGAVHFRMDDLHPALLQLDLSFQVSSGIETLREHAISRCRRQLHLLRSETGGPKTLGTVEDYLQQLGRGSGDLDASVARLVLAATNLDLLNEKLAAAV